MYLIQIRDQNKEVIYDNTKSGGIDMFRPLRKSSGKESEDAIVKSIQRIKEEAAALEDTVLVRANGKTIRVRHNVLYTMLDGKCRCVVMLKDV
jgi:hypothetical protein